MASCLVIDLNSLEAESSCADSAFLSPSSFMDVVAELRQGPAQLRVLRNSPRAMPLSGLPIIVMTALYISRKLGKLQCACACGGPEIHGCKFGLSAPVVLLIELHGCGSWVFAPVVSDCHCHVSKFRGFAPVVGNSYADRALLPTRALNG